MGASCLDRASWGKWSLPAPMLGGSRETGCPAASRAPVLGAPGREERGERREEAGAFPELRGRACPARPRSGISRCPGNEGR